MKPKSAKKSEKENYQELLDYLLALVTRFNYSTKEITEKIARKTTDTTLQKRLLSELQRLGLLDDHKTALALLEKYSKIRKRGRFFIARKLRAKGITEPIIEEVLSERSEEEELSLAESEVRRILKVSPRLKLATLVNRLLSRGFSRKIIYKVITKLQEGGGNEVSNSHF